MTRWLLNIFISVLVPLLTIILWTYYTASLPGPHCVIRDPFGHRQQLIDFRSQLKLMMLENVDRERSLFPIQNLNDVCLKTTARQRLYAKFYKERQPITSALDDLPVRQRLEKIAKQFNAHYHQQHSTNDAKETILYLLHLLQDVLDFKRNYFLHTQELQGIPRAHTLRMYPDFHLDFDVKYVCELSMVKRPHMPFSHCIAVLIIKALEVGLSVNKFQLDD